MKGQTYIILSIIFAIVIAIFAVINVEPVQVNFLFSSGEAPLILVILLSVLLGGLATASVGAVRYYRLKRENHTLKKKLDESGETITETESVESGEEKETEEEDTSYKTT
ncbi:lipopolysaccharide assembly protein LapA domain-containing protein [Halobacillus litoralis]|uniref:LapA family protein n=1 Tax=Halobacillus litoralis TaxID=45668 RepID=UPI001CD7C651|nr:lipopolysaccharide assembly protein LapA domain-containing protein [Halobacillus litoralis]MCA0969968.1 lipopolysaccharide assembly protein LapA domain-containing protein [Halobacillus litoralis]